MFEVTQDRAGMHLGMEWADEQKFIDFLITCDFKEINQCVVVAFMCK
jgi:hypothetical protein